MVQIIMTVMACCAVLGGIDRIIGNKLGLGKAFEEGFQILGPIALSMTGIICFAPVLSSVLGTVVRPFYRLIGQDPGMFGSILSIDMGGYQMAMGLADDKAIGSFAGIIAASMLGCTLCFTIPVGMGMFKPEVRRSFSRGILYGFISIPVALFFGALICGFSVGTALWLDLPVLLLSALIMFLLFKFPAGTMKAFSGFALFLKWLTTAGLAIAAFQYLSGIVILKDLTPVEESMAIISSIGVTMLGSLPFAKILEWALKKPMSLLGKSIGIGSEGIMGMLLFYINATPGLTAVPQMTPRAQTVVAAFAVCTGSCLTAHFAFTMDVEPALALPLLVTKLLGGIVGAVFALWMTRKDGKGGQANAGGE